VAREIRQRGAVQPYRAVLRRIVTGDDVERRGLAAAVGADQPVDPPGRNVEIETIDGASGG